jgi:hypothetical protein
MARRVIRDSHLDETFARGAWREEAATFYRQRVSIWFVLAVMIGMSAFWTNPWAFTAFFAIFAAYSAWVGVRIGVLCGLSFALWFVALREGWVHPLDTANRVAGLWCIATLFLLVVWKHDGVEQHGKGPVNAADHGSGA